MEFPSADELRKRAAENRRNAALERDQLALEAQQRQDAFIAVIAQYVERLLELGYSTHRLTGTPPNGPGQSAIVWAEVHPLGVTNLSVMAPPGNYGVSTLHARKKLFGGLEYSEHVSTTAVVELTFIGHGLAQDHSGNHHLSLASNDGVRSYFPAHWGPAELQKSLVALTVGEPLSPVPLPSDYRPR